MPSRDTHEFIDTPVAVRAAIDDVYGSYDIGLPVLVFGNVADRWTILGTRAVLSFYDGALHHCALPQIAGFNNPKASRVPKQNRQYLTVRLVDSSTVQLWGPRGSQFFALWNILVGLSNMNRASDLH